MQLKYNEGNLHEPAVLSELEKEGWDLYGKQEGVVLQVTDTVFVVGHLDAFGLWEGEDRVVEVKTMGDSSFKEFERRDWQTPGLIQKYKWQLSVYMLATGKPGLLVVKDRNSGRMMQIKIPEPFYSLEQIRKRVLEAEVWVKKGELPKECDIEMYPCPFMYLEEREAPVVLQDEELDKLAKQYQDSLEGEKLAKEKKEKSRAALRAGIGEHKRVVLGSGTKITFYSAKNPPRTDIEKMKEDGVDVEKYQSQSESERLRVTIKEKEEEGIEESASSDRDE